MAQSLEVQIKATSDVPQAVDRAKEAITSLEKRASSVKVGTAGGAVEQTTAKATGKVESQFDRIGKSFGNTMSSVFLSFLGPLAIVSGIIAFVSNSIAEAKQLATDGLNRIAEGKSKLATDEETKMANFFKVKDAREKEEKEVAAGKKEMTRRFLAETAEGQRIQKEADARGETGTHGGIRLEGRADIQKQALDAFLKSDEGKKYGVLFESEKANKDAFKPPEGFGNVIGVGANPVMEAMARQTEIQEQSLGELKKISGTDTGVPADFTKKRMTQ